MLKSTINWQEFDKNNKSTWPRPEHSDQNFGEVLVYVPSLRKVIVTTFAVHLGMGIIFSGLGESQWPTHWADMPVFPKKV